MKNYAKRGAHTGEKCGAVTAKWERGRSLRRGCAGTRGEGLLHYITSGLATGYAFKVRVVQALSVKVKLAPGPIDTRWCFQCWD